MREASRSLEALIHGWARLGHPVPVAVIVSIFDDLLESADRAPAARAYTPLHLDDVVIDEKGLARIPKRAGLVRLEALADLFARALMTGPFDDLVPPAAWPLLLRIESADPLDRPRDGEEVRGWVRDALGAPAPRDEVARALACLHGIRGRKAGVGESLPPDLESGALPVNPSTEDGIHAAVFEETSREATTDVSEALPLDPPSRIPEEPVSILAPVYAEEPYVNETLIEVPMDPIEVSSSLPPSEVFTDEEQGATSVDGRPVVRHHLPRPSVRLASAPAARQSAKPSQGPGDALEIPYDRPRLAAWVFVISLIVIGALFWLRYL